MKLRNKKTGEIGEIGYIGSTDGSIAVNPINRVACETIASYNSLAELNAEWEDYEELDEIWYIDLKGDIRSADINNEWECEKEIGNYFETKEEAELAVRKLKAWKRLKDKGFRFILDGETEMPMFVYSGANGEKCITSAEESKQCRDDIKLLFGGEE